MTKNKILEVASTEFSKYGYDAVSMNKLAAKMEVNKATIYYYFKDKRSLYQEVIKTIIDKSRVQKESVLSSNQEPKEKFKNYVKAITIFLNQDKQIIPLALREMANSGQNVDSFIEEELSRDIAELKDILFDLDIKQKYKNIDIFDIKSMIFGTMSLYYSMYSSRFELKDIHKFDNENEVLDYIGELTCDMILDAVCETRG